MKDCTELCEAFIKPALDAAEAYGDPGNYVMGANIAGFLKVAKAMLAYGVV